MEWEDDKPEVKRVVRGYQSCTFHADILNKFISEELGDMTEWRKMRYVNWSPGGGWLKITNTKKEKKIKLYGWSFRYGQANHQEAVEILKRDWSEFKFETSDEYN